MLYVIVPFIANDGRIVRKRVVASATDGGALFHYNSKKYRRNPIRFSRFMLPKFKKPFPVIDIKSIMSVQPLKI